MFTHFEGATSLLKVRRLQGRSKDSPLDRVVRRQIVRPRSNSSDRHNYKDLALTRPKIRGAILRGQRVPKWLQDGLEYGEEEPALSIDAFMIRAAAIRARSIAFFSETSHVPMTMDNIVDVATEARTLDLDLTKWSWNVPEDWRYTTVDVNTPSSSCPDASSSFEDRVHKYDNYTHASLWLRYRALRLITNSIMLRCLRTAREIAPEATHLFSKADLMAKIMASLATEMCASVPYFFTTAPKVTTDTVLQPARNVWRDDRIVDATAAASAAVVDSATVYAFSHPNAVIAPKVAGLLAWPLAVAVSTEHVPELQRRWLQARLKLAAQAIGDSVLESVVERGEFKF